MIPLWGERAWQDLRYGVRSLWRERVFSTVLTGTLVLGIGLVAAWFTVFNGFLLRPWPLPDPDNVVIGARGVSATEFRYLRERVSTLQLVAFAQTCPIVRIEDDPRPVGCDVVSFDFFDILRIPLVRGRAFVEAEDQPGSPVAVVIISHGLWGERFGFADSAVGSTLVVNGEPYLIVGVAPREAHLRPTPVVPRLWFPLAHYNTLNGASALDFLFDPSVCCVEIAGRLVSSAESATAELTNLHLQFKEAHDSYGGSLAVVDTREISQPWSQSGPTVIGFVFAGLALVMAIACANAATLQLARGRRRRAEFFVRVALGATRAHLVWQLLTESVIIIGAVSLIVTGGLIAATTAVHRLVIARTGDLGVNLSPDWRVVAFCVSLAALAVILSGLAPPLRGAGQLSQASRHRRLRYWSLSVQVGASTVLIVCSTLLATGMRRAATADLGFDARGVARFFVSHIDGARLSTARASAITRELMSLTDPQGRPLVARADLPRVHAQPSIFEGLPIGVVDAIGVTTNYLPLVKVTRREGRLLQDSDSASEVVINATFARRAWPADTAVGKVFDAGGRRQVVGVVADMAQVGSNRQPRPTFFQRGAGGIFHVTGDADAEARVRAAIGSLDPATRVRFEALATSFERALQSAAVGVWFSWAIGLVALAIASSGVFAVFTLITDQRRQEIGIRVALGAMPRDVARLLARSSIRALTAGGVGGVAMALAATPLLRGILPEVQALDPAAYIIATGVIVGAGLVATWVPVRRALRQNPASTLRAD